MPLITISPLSWLWIYIKKIVHVSCLIKNFRHQVSQFKFSSPFYITTFGYCPLRFFFNFGYFLPWTQAAQLKCRKSRLFKARILSWRFTDLASKGVSKQPTQIKKTRVTLTASIKAKHKKSEGQNKYIVNVFTNLIIIPKIDIRTFCEQLWSCYTIKIIPNFYRNQNAKFEVIVRFNGWTDGRNLSVEKLRLKKMG